MTYCSCVIDINSDIPGNVYAVMIPLITETGLKKDMILFKNPLYCLKMITHKTNLIYFKTQYSLLSELKYVES